MTADHCGACHHWSAEVFALDGFCRIGQKATHRADTCAAYEDWPDNDPGPVHVVYTQNGVSRTEKLEGGEFLVLTNNCYVDRITDLSEGVTSIIIKPGDRP